jgi:hypothetical protein
LLDYFKPNEEMDEYLKKYHNLLDDNTCSVHIRRGDYLRFPNDHPTLLNDYYFKSFDKMKKNTKFIVFSDDITWCKDNIKGNNMFYIEDETDYVNLILMSLCKHNIIANSSFSWWGAWLNKNKNKKVIAPKIWFGPNKNLNTKDLIPNKWITI